MSTIVNHACQGTYAFKQRSTFCILTSFWTYMCRRAHIIPYSLVYTYFCQAFTVLRAMIFVDLFWIFPLAVCLLLMYWYACQFWVHIWISFLLLQILLLLSTWLFPSCSLMRGRIGHVKQLSDRRVQIYSNSPGARDQLWPCRLLRKLASFNFTRIIP